MFEILHALLNDDYDPIKAIYGDIDKVFDDFIGVTDFLKNHPIEYIKLVEENDPQSYNYLLNEGFLQEDYLGDLQVKFEIMNLALKDKKREYQKNQLKSV